MNNKIVQTWAVLLVSSLGALVLLFYTYNPNYEWNVAYVFANFVSVPLGVSGIYCSIKLFRSEYKNLGILLLAVSILIVFPFSEYASSYGYKLLQPISNKYEQQAVTATIGRYEKNKNVIYTQLKEIFREPVKIVGVKNSRILFENNIQAYLYGTPLVRSSGANRLDSVLQKELLNKVIKVTLPNESDFIEEYVPGTNLSVFEDRKYSKFGDVPVLIYYTDGSLLNIRDQAADADMLSEYKKQNSINVK